MRYFFIVLQALLVMGCGSNIANDVSARQSASGIVIASTVELTLAPTNPNIVVGQDQPLNVTAVYSDGTRADVTRLALFSSDNMAVVTTAANGVAHAVAPGTTRITATSGGFQAATNITVNPVTPVKPP